MEYLFLLLPASSLIISYRYNRKYKKLKGGGKIPEIRSAKNYTELFLALAMILIIGFVFFELSPDC
jgi:hypothetical protein